MTSGSVTPEQLETFSDLSAAEIDEFVQAWRELPADGRYEVVRVMVETGEADIAKSFDRILAVVLSDNDPRVRRTAIRGLWEASSPTAVKSLIALLESEADESVTRQLITTLAGIAEHQNLGDELTSHLDEALMRKATDGESGRIRREALAAASIIRNDDAIASLVRETFASDDEEDLTFAVRAMGRLGVSNWRSEIQQALRSPDDEIRAEAITAVGASGNQQYLSTIVQMALEEEDDVQLAAIWTLGEIGGASAVQALEQLSESDDPEIAEVALNALEQATLLEDFTSAPRLGPQSSTESDAPAS